MYTKIVEVPNLSLNGEDTVCVCPPLTLTLNEYPPPPPAKKLSLWRNTLFGFNRLEYNPTELIPRLSSQQINTQIYMYFKYWDKCLLVKNLYDVCFDQKPE